MLDRTALRMRVWERGSGETAACGTGACAVLVAAVLNDKADRRAMIHLNGGDLEIEWNAADNHVFMTGPADGGVHGRRRAMAVIETADVRPEKPARQVETMFSGSMPAIITPFRDGHGSSRRFRTPDRVSDRQRHRRRSSRAAAPASRRRSRTRSMPTSCAWRSKSCAGRVPVIAGTGSNSTAEAINLTRAAKEAGAAAALLISPYYNKPTQDGIYLHYKAIAEATRFPLIVYNIPGRTASKIEATTIARLAELEHIVGLKEATGSLDEVQEVIRLCGDKIEVYCGRRRAHLPIMAVGGVGVISVTANVAPARMRPAAGVLRGDWGWRRQLQLRLLPPVIRRVVHRDQPDSDEGRPGDDGLLPRRAPSSVCRCEGPRAPSCAGKREVSSWHDQSGKSRRRTRRALGASERPLIEGMTPIVVCGAAGRMGDASSVD